MYFTNMKFIDTIYNMTYDGLVDVATMYIKQLSIELTKLGYYVKAYDYSLNFDLDPGILGEDNKELNILLYITWDDTQKDKCIGFGKVIYDSDLKE